MDADSNTKQPVGTPTDAEAATVDFAIREDQIQNAVAFLSHPKVSCAATGLQTDTPCMSAHNDQIANACARALCPVCSWNLFAGC